MRREWRWALAAVAALAVGAICAEPYARLASPCYAAMARLIAQTHPWEIVGVDVAPNANGPGSVLRLTGLVRERRDDPVPAGKLVSKLQVAAIVASPAIFWTLLLVWPAVSIRQRLAFLAAGVPIFVCLEMATTVCQLLSPLAYGSAVLAGESNPVTVWERWSRFIENGGRFALAVLAAMITVSLVQIARNFSSASIAAWSR
jgi:hypothetical protein